MCSLIIMKMSVNNVPKQAPKVFTEQLDLRLNYMVSSYLPVDPWRQVLFRNIRVENPNCELFNYAYCFLSSRSKYSFCC